MSKLIVFVAAAFGLDVIPVFAAGNDSSSASSGRPWPAGGKPDRVVAGDPLFFCAGSAGTIQRPCAPFFHQPPKDMS